MTSSSPPTTTVTGDDVLVLQGDGRSDRRAQRHPEHVTRGVGQLQTAVLHRFVRQADERVTLRRNDTANLYLDHAEPERADRGRCRRRLVGAPVRAPRSASSVLSRTPAKPPRRAERRPAHHGHQRSRRGSQGGRSAVGVLLRADLAGQPSAYCVVRRVVMPAFLKFSIRCCHESRPRKAFTAPNDFSIPSTRTPSSEPVVFLPDIPRRARAR